MAPLSPDTGRAGSRDCRPVNQSPGPGLEAKVIPECHTYNKQTNKQGSITPSMFIHMTKGQQFLNP